MNLGYELKIVHYESVGVNKNLLLIIDIIRILGV